ncbi:MAG TPA: alpha/beta hydrolase [Ramlibacter sp.]|nr:alpha/beta hydrolase [Ramlibacter sp.]
MDTSPPEWFDWAVRQPRRSHFADAGGTRIHYVSWNADEAEKPGLLFLHGFLGHSHWWDFIAPFFTERFRVYALDFSGMGKSEARADYGTGSFVSDIAAVMRHAGIAPGIAVGHSFGGSRLLQACAMAPETIARAIVLDSYFALDEHEERPRHERRPPPRPYPDEATGIGRFRLLPPQECAPWMVEYIARHSLRQDEAGWGWRFDPLLRQLPPPEGDLHMLGRIAVPVDYVHAECSAVVGAERARRIVAAIPQARGPVTLARAHHHLMLDQPLALVAALRALLA